MKFLRASTAKGPKNRKEALACLTANLALPGSGSLAAGRPIGYYQLALAALATILTIITGIRLLLWITSNSAHINDPTADPFQNFLVMWRQLLWPLASLGLFAVSMLWAVVTSMQVLAEHPKNPVPPRIVN
jgi:hypothetical protein